MLRDPDDDGQGIGRGGGGHGRGPETTGSRQEGRAQRDVDARNDHENTLPLGGRVVGHVRLYRERGEGGGGRERRAPQKIRQGTKSVEISRRDKDRGQEPRD